tara:strand:- start:241 stop:561 length:321 start_codon:yes stop_codon:yes gene_type:complete
MSYLEQIKSEEALKSLSPTGKWSWGGITSDYSKLIWHDSSIAKPTEAQIKAEVSRLDTLKTNEAYKDKRQAEYPSYADQLDKIYHSGLNAWKADIKAIKDKYPKPS